MASEGIGQRLRSARTARRLSLDDIAAATRIRTRYLDALEREAWDELPGATYVKGFLGTYARYLGLPSNEILGVHPSPGAVAASAVVPRSVEVRITPATPHSRLRRIVTAVAVVLVAGAIVLAYVLVGQLRQFAATRSRPQAGTPASMGAPASSPSAPSAVTAPASGTSTAPSTGTPSVAPTPAQPAEPSGATPALAGHPAGPGTMAVGGPVIVLAAQVIDRSWVRVVSDGSVVFEGFLSAGDRQVWQGRHLVTIRIGNASALDLSVNGRPLGRLGNPGDVVDRTFSTSAPSSAPTAPAAPPAKPVPAAPPAKTAPAPSAPPASAPPAGVPAGPPPPPNSHQ